MSTFYTPRTISTTSTPRTTKVYLSGPMSGLPELNIPTFNAAAHALRQIGYEVFNPAEIKIDTSAMFASHCPFCGIKLEGGAA